MIATFASRPLHRFGGVENAAAQQPQTDGREIIRAHAVPARVESETFGGGRGLGVRGRTDPGALDGFA